MTKLSIPFSDDPMGHPPGTGGTPEQIEAARKSILEDEDEYVLAEMRRIAEGCDDAEPRPKGCECHLEAGDSPCPVHGDTDE